MAKSNNSKKYIEHWALGCPYTPCVADYISPVSEILRRDYPRENLRAFNNIYAWDADRYENKKYGNQSSETVDLVFGMDYGNILMVEAKLSVQNVENIKGEVEAKIKNTREYVVSYDNFKKVIEPSIVLFGQKHFHELYTRYRRMRNNKTDIVPMTLSEFHDKYFVSAKKLHM